MTFVWAATLMTLVEPIPAPEVPTDDSNRTAYETRIGDWRIVGTIEPPGPRISYWEGRVCDARSNGVGVRIRGDGQAHVHFGTSGSSDDHSWGTSNLASLRIDGIVYETRVVSLASVPHSADAEPVPMIALFSGYAAFRTGPEQPWIEISSLLPTLLSARTLNVGFRENVDGVPTPIETFRVRLSGLGAGLVRCQEALGIGH